MSSALVPLLLAAAAASSPVPADVADLRCVAIFSVLVGDGIPEVKLSDEQRNGLGSMVMYYVGKLEGRGNGVNIEEGLKRELGPDAALDRLIREDLPRCGQEAEVQGNALTQMGKNLEATGK